MLLECLTAAVYAHGAGSSKHSTESSNAVRSLVRVAITWNKQTSKNQAVGGCGMKDCW